MLDVGRIAREIHQSVRRQALAEQGAEQDNQDWSRSLAEFQLAYEELYGLRDCVGKLPPKPNTIRARIGQCAVLLVL